MHAPLRHAATPHDKGSESPTLGIQPSPGSQGSSIAPGRLGFEPHRSTRHVRSAQDHVANLSRDSRRIMMPREHARICRKATPGGKSYGSRAADIRVSCADDELKQSSSLRRVPSLSLTTASSAKTIAPSV